MSVKAFEIVCVNKLQATTGIECLEYCGVNLYIGGPDSLLQHYVVEDKNQQTPFQASKQQQKDLGIKKPILEIKCASALNRLLVLCDGAIHMVSTFDLECVPNGTKIKNVNSFIVNENPLNSNPFSLEICLARKRSVHVYHVTEDTATHVREISLSEPPLAMAMDGKFVCVALSTKYAIVNCEADTVMDVLPYDPPATVPLVIRLNKEEFLVNGPNALGIFVTSAGTSERPPILWSKGVHAITFTHPYILALHDDLVVIYSILDQKQKQRIHFQGGTHLEHFQGRTLAVAANSIYALMPVPCGKQVRALLADGNVSEALDLAKHCHWPGLSREQFLKVYMRIQQEAGFIELANFNFEHARELFICGQLDPRELVTLYPDLMPSSSDFVKSVPPLHSLANIVHMCQSDGDRIRECTHFLLRFLEETRENRNNGKWRKDVDVVILKVYAQLDHPELASIILSSSSQPAVVNECEEWLNKCQRYHALALFAKHKQGDDEKALKIWMQLVEEELVDPSFPGLPFVVDVLANLKDENLVWRYAGVVLEKDPEMGVTIFTERILDEANDMEEGNRVGNRSMTVDGVAEYLRQFPLALINYLEHLVFVRLSQKERFHTQLAILYLERVQSCSDEVHKASSRKQLQHILRWSTLYRVQFVLGRVEAMQLHLEAAILYGKLEEHERALQLLVHQLNDSEAAIEHCDFYSKGQNITHRQNLFRQLLSVYLDPQLEPKRREELFHPAIDLLNSELSDFDDVSVLSLLPDHWSASVVDTFLFRAVRKTLSDRRCKQVEKGMAKVENIQVKFQLYLTQRNAICVTEDGVCALCGKTLDESQVARFPSGQITHVTCSKRVPVHYSRKHNERVHT